MLLRAARTAVILAAVLSGACGKRNPSSSFEMLADRKDHHTLANPHEIQVKHVDLDLTINFVARVLSGTATLTVDRSPSYSRGPLALDTRALDVKRCECAVELGKWSECKWQLGPADPILGARLTVDTAPEAKFVRVHYATRPDASGLQWLTAAQTAGKKHPYLFSQSQAIHARSWVPVQDSPAVRTTYTARVRTPPSLVALMSAENDPTAPRSGEYTFRMSSPIPSYLMAIAAGDINFRPIGKRTAVYSEAGVVDRAAVEFADTQAMMMAAEELFGPYRWGRYDILVLPPSFPFGGMENPRLTFATPTLLAGDKSLVDTIAHELAHSWSGNLVTNATWRDFWLNEGFTTYLTLRIQEKVFGRDRAEMEAVLAWQALQEEFKRLPPADQVLYVDLKGRDPDEAMTDVPYVKGMLFLRTLEQAFGRQRFDAFLRSYFEQFAFQSITTADFAGFLQTNLFVEDPEVAARVPLEEWLTKPGLPAGVYRPESRALAKVAAEAKSWISGQLATTSLPARNWSTQEWLYFLRSLPERIGSARMAELDREFSLTATSNAEIASYWLMMAVRNGYEQAYPRLEQFIVSIGRIRYLRPLYEELAKTPEGRKRAAAIFARARPGYHPMTAAMASKIVGLE